jgi:hypothetical protein
MNLVRLRVVAAGTAEFEVSYGGKTARIKLEGLETTGGPEEDSIPWQPFYQERLKELFEAIMANDTQWTDRGSE